MKRMMLVAMVSMSLVFPAMGRSMGSMMSGPRMGGSAIGGFRGSGGGSSGAIGGFRGGAGGFRGSVGAAPRASGSLRGAMGGFRGSFGTAPSGGGWSRGSTGGFRSSVGVPSPRGSWFSPSHSSGFSSRTGSGWFSTARRDFDFGFRRHHFDRDTFILSFGYPFFDFYYPFYWSFGIGLGYWYYPYYPYYPYCPYYPYYPYGYYPGYAYPPYERDRERPSAPTALGDELLMQWQRGGKLLVGWTGHAARVKQVEFTLLDSHRQLLTLQIARRAPFSTIFAAPPDEAAYVQMAVVYANGSVDSVIRPLPDSGTPPEGPAEYS